MTKDVKTIFNRVGLLSGAGLLAIATSVFAGTAALAEPPADSATQQIAQDDRNRDRQPQRDQNQQQRQQPQRQPQQRQQPQMQQRQRLEPPQQQFQRQQLQQQQQRRALQQQQQRQRDQQRRVIQQQQQNRARQQQQFQQQQRPPSQQGRIEPQRRDQMRPQQAHRYNWSTYQPGRRPPQWQQYRRNFDPYPYSGNWRATHRYHWRPYVQPHGWYYRRWVYGDYLPFIFWIRDYWILSYWDFGLIDPPYGFVWVRYGSDAMLVDVESGFILRVVYGVFY